MVISFSVTNFKSIYDKTTLSMVATKLTGKDVGKGQCLTPKNYDKLPLLTTATIFGANASGKSTFFRAMEVFRNFIVRSTELKFGEKIRNYEPFGLNKSSIQEPTAFEMDFIAKDDIRYKYYFCYDNDSILDERLVSYASKKPTILFDRTDGEISYSTQLKGRKKFLEEQLLSNHLFLTKAANSNFDQLQSIYTFFSEYFIISTDKVTNINDPFKSFSKKVSFSDPYYQANIIKFLKIADTGIDDFIIKKEIDQNISKALKSLSDSIYTRAIAEDLTYHTHIVHKFQNDSGGIEQVVWNISNESSGTRKLFDLAGPIIDVLNSGKILIFDEMNSSLHPLICEFIVNLFNDPTININNAQLIFTTHDTTLLSKNIFRRDQVWFTEKNNEGKTELFCLSSFNKKDVRWNIPFDRWYLSGRFGGLPLIKDLQLDINKLA